VLHERFSRPWAGDWRCEDSAGDDDEGWALRFGWYVVMVTGGWDGMGWDGKDENTDVASSFEAIWLKHNDTVRASWDLGILL
jgi:hypothetical protein